MPNTPLDFCSYVLNFIFIIIFFSLLHSDPKSKPLRFCYNFIKYTHTKLRLYQALHSCIGPLYVAETWTLRVADVRTLEAFHMRCRSTSDSRCPLVASHTVRLPRMGHIAKRRCASFGHIARLSEAFPSNQALRCHIDASVGRRYRNARGNVDLDVHTTANLGGFPPRFWLFSNRFVV